MLPAAPRSALTSPGPVPQSVPPSRAPPFTDLLFPTAHIIRHAERLAASSDPVPVEAASSAASPPPAKPTKGAARSSVPRPKDLMPKEDFPDGFIRVCFGSLFC